MIFSGLVGDDETRRIIAHAYGAIRPAESSPAENYTAEQAIADVRRHLDIDYPPSLPAPEPPAPDDGGSPSVASKPAAATTQKEASDEQQR